MHKGGTMDQTAEDRARGLCEEHQRRWTEASDAAFSSRRGGDELAMPRLGRFPRPDYRQESPEVKEALLRLYGVHLAGLQSGIRTIKDAE